MSQYDPFKRCVAFFIAPSQVFVSKTSPGNLSNYPAASCITASLLSLLPASHCVDDVIFIEKEMVVCSGKVCWELLMELCGWQMSQSKDAPPASRFPIIGASLDLGPSPGPARQS